MEAIFIVYAVSCVLHLARNGKIKEYYILGEDPVQSEPDANGIREA